MSQSAQQFKEAAAKRRKTAEVEIDGLGPVKLRALSAGDAQTFGYETRKLQADGKNENDKVFELIARSWIGEDNELWFPEEEGVEVARSLDVESFTAITKAVLKLNGLSADAIEEAEKNSPASRSDFSLTDSRKNSATRTST